jgi:predicted AlkP superfamily pyrophosphatase or phosphodiesterase
MDDFCSGKSFSIPRYPRSNTLTTSLGLQDDYSYICEYIIMFSSFFMICFMNDITTMIVYRNLCLYCSMSFLLAYRIVHFPSFFIYRSGYLLFYVQSVKYKKPGKYFSTSSGVFSLFVMLYIFCGIGTHFLINLLIF